MISSTSGANINAEIIIPACLTVPDFLMMLLHLEVRIPKKNEKKKRDAIKIMGQNFIKVLVFKKKG